MNKEWLQKVVTVGEAEAAHMRKIDRLGPEPVAFGFQNQKWRSLLAQMQEGDELREYCSSAESWAARAGRRGIALVRNGEVIDCIVTLMN